MNFNNWLLFFPPKQRSSLSADMNPKEDTYKHTSEQAHRKHKKTWIY